MLQDYHVPQRYKYKREYCPFRKWRPTSNSVVLITGKRPCLFVSVSSTVCINECAQKPHLNSTFIAVFRVNIRSENCLHRTPRKSAVRARTTATGDLDNSRRTPRKIRYYATTRTSTDIICRPCRRRRESRMRRIFVTLFRKSGFAAVRPNERQIWVKFFRCRERKS